MDRSYKVSLVSIVICVILGLGNVSVEAFQSSNLVIPLNNGMIVNARHTTSEHGRNVISAYGLPYAEPPIGNRRFKNPELLGQQNNVTYSALNSKDKCIQLVPLSGNPNPEGSEDCLYLNVHVPEYTFNTNKPLAVVVFFHGGLFQSGNISMYDPRWFMDYDVVFVTVAFRQGIMGFLSTEDLSCPGNFGLKDQIVALQWIQQNIAAFKGDPKRVIVMGESSGAGAVGLHTLSPLAKGLISGAVAISGTPLDPWALPPLPGKAQAKAKTLAQMFNCDDVNGNWTNIMNCLRTVPAADIVAAQPKFLNPNAFFQTVGQFPPVVEPVAPGAYMTSPPRPNQQNLVPMIVGYNQMEGILYAGFLSRSDAFKKTIRSQLPIILNYDYRSLDDQKNITDTLMQLYFNNDTSTISFDNMTALANLFGDMNFISGFGDWVKFRSQVKQTTYGYCFNNFGYASYTEFFFASNKYLGTMHMDGLLSLFPIGDSLFPTSSPKIRDILLRDLYIRSIISFASTGNPNNNSTFVPTWNPITSYPPQLNQIGSQNQSFGAPFFQMGNFYPDHAEIVRNLKIYAPQLRLGTSS